jgi:hypothetical protein
MTKLPYSKPTLTRWDSGSPSFNERCILYIELMGQEAFDHLLEPYILWGDSAIPRNIPEDKFPQVYKAMCEQPSFIEGLMRTGRRGIALQIIEEAAK